MFDRMFDRMTEHFVSKKHWSLEATNEWLTNNKQCFFISLHSQFLYLILHLNLNHQYQLRNVKTVFCEHKMLEVQLKVAKALFMTRFRRLYTTKFGRAFK